MLCDNSSVLILNRLYATSFHTNVSMNDVVLKCVYALHSVRKYYYIT